MQDLMAGARLHGDRVAVRDTTGSVTYGQLAARANALALRLQKRLQEQPQHPTAGSTERRESAPGSDGVPETGEPAPRVAILVTPGAEWVIALWAVWLAGGVAVPLSPQHPPAEWQYVLHDADVSGVLVDVAFSATISGVAAAAGVPIMPTSAGAQDTPLPPAPLAHRRALILYTSGTTGKPKGVVHTHGSLRAQVASLVTAWEWTAADRTLLVLPLHHVHGVVNVVCCALASGACVTVHERFDADAVWRELETGALTLFHAVPTIWRRLLDHWEQASVAERIRREAAVSSMRLLVSGSAALPVSLLDRWQALCGHVLLERYGMTELGMVLSNPLHGTRVPGHVGNALPGVQVRAVDDAGAPVADGQVGSLEVRGATVMREYWRRPAETSAAFRNGWFRTGDVAVHEETVGGRSWRLLGRESTDIIKTGGYKVSALEIEEVLRMHHAIRECAVVGLPDEEWGECVAVAVELADGQSAASLSLAELRAFAKERLATYKVPTRLQVMTFLPRNAMGKVVKPDVRAAFA